MIYIRPKHFYIYIGSASSECVTLQSGRREVNISSSSEYNWEGLLCEDWVTCECFGIGEGSENSQTIANSISSILFKEWHLNTYNVQFL